MKQLSFLHREDNAKKTTVTLYIDGASRGNPGPASVGCVIKKAGKTLEEHGYYLGVRTNNQAEYAALILGLALVKPYIMHDDELLIMSDSELLVKQLNGHYRVKDPILQNMFMRAKKMLQGIDHHITHVLRAHNTHADMLANKALDNKIRLPDNLVPLVHNA